jgi:hypothetical protein
MNKTITLGEQRQLIELNSDLKEPNFDLTFKVTATKGESFDIVVVDQKTLDTNPNLNFKRVNGTISGNIIADQNIEQSYLLCLKAPEPCEVNITTNIKPLPYNTSIGSEQHSINQDRQIPVPTQKIHPEAIHRFANAHTKKHSFMTLKNIALVLVVLGAGWFVWSSFSKKKPETYSETSTSSSSFPLGQNVGQKVNSFPLGQKAGQKAGQKVKSSRFSSASSVSSASSHSSGGSSSSGSSGGSSSSGLALPTISKSLLDRLNNLPLR